MTAISNGTMPFGLPGANAAPGPFGLPVPRRRRSGCPLLRRHRSGCQG